MNDLILILLTEFISRDEFHLTYWGWIAPKLNAGVYSLHPTGCERRKNNSTLFRSCVAPEGKRTLETSSTNPASFENDGITSRPD